MPTATVLQIDPRDDLIVALTDLNVGETVEWPAPQSAFRNPKSEIETSAILQSLIPAKHKFAAHDLRAGQRLRMYGVTVAEAVTDISAGERITTDNVRAATDPVERTGRRVQWQPPDVSRWQNVTFDGYRRGDGRVGTANNWLVIPLVFCENRNIEKIRDALLDELGYGHAEGYRAQTRQLLDLMTAGQSADQIAAATLGVAAPTDRNRTFPNVDGISFLTHNIGCGGTRDDALMLCRLIAAYINHPNVAGATVLSLGCQNAQVSLMQQRLAELNPSFDKPLHIFEQQQQASESEMLSEAIRHTFTGLMQANQYRRQPTPLGHLTLAVECGGSDGFSGITANPALGHCADLLCALGGTVILSEFPELSGAETELVSRCVDERVAERFLQLMQDYASRAEAIGSGFRENPSPGNIADGLITDPMKSLGAAKKGGTSPVVDVLDYTEIATKPGLNLLCSPGGDLESVTAMVGSGATVVCFTTGLGTPTGNAVAPVLKISSNSDIATRLSDMIDFNAGGIVDAEDTIESAGRRLLDLVIETASGRFTPAANKLGQDDWLPWKRGVSL